MNSSQRPKSVSGAEWSTDQTCGLQIVVEKKSDPVLSAQLRRRLLILLHEVYVSATDPTFQPWDRVHGDKAGFDALH